MSKVERRTTASKLTAADGDGMSFSGHAALFNTRALIGPKKGGFYEQIAPGAFSKLLSARADVRMVFNHDANQLLGRTASGTLRLSEDATGLRSEGDLPDTSLGRDLSTLIARGDITGQSIQFIVGKDTWSPMPGGHSQLRTIAEVSELIDVGPVTYPAYEATTASVRAVRAYASGDDMDAPLELIAAVDAAVDAALAASAGGDMVTFKALLLAAECTSDVTEDALGMGWGLPDELTPELLAQFSAIDEYLDAALAAAAIADYSTSAVFLTSADTALDTLTEALGIPDPDEGRAAHPSGNPAAMRFPTKQSFDRHARALLALNRSA